MDMTLAAPNLLLVHGAWHGAWCWEALTPELVRRGWAVHTVDLPSASADRANQAGMYDDARAVRAALERIGGPVVVLAHSYGGLPVTEAAAAASNVSRLIYLAAFLVDPGVSLNTAIADPLPSGHSGTLPPPPDPVAMLYADVPAVLADRAVARLVPQTIRSFNEVLSGPARTTIPSAYLVCENDQAIPATVQKTMAGRATEVHSLPSAHSPFYSMPAELAELIDVVATPAG
jgi:pimeloyl-ACP methyl ester carboxylesterase